MAESAATSPEHPVLGVAAKAIIRRDDGTILLIRRSATSKAYPGTWDLPGGKMDRGERLVDALAREAREETGLLVSEPWPIHVANFEKSPFWVTCVTFVCDGSDGDVRLSSEHDEHLWVSPLALEGRPYAPTIREQLDAFVSLLADLEPER